MVPTPAFGSGRRQSLTVNFEQFHDDTEKTLIAEYRRQRNTKLWNDWGDCILYGRVAFMIADSKFASIREACRELPSRLARHKLSDVLACARGCDDKKSIETHKFCQRGRWGSGLITAKQSDDLKTQIAACEQCSQPMTSGAIEEAILGFRLVNSGVSKARVKLLASNPYYKRKMLSQTTAKNWKRRMNRGVLAVNKIRHRKL